MTNYTLFCVYRYGKREAERDTCRGKQRETKQIDKKTETERNKERMGGKKREKERKREREKERRRREGGRKGEERESLYLAHRLTSSSFFNLLN